MAEAAIAGSGLDRRRWVLLWVVGLAQLMVVLDLTVMNIALPSAQQALHFSTVDRQWVVTAYTLSFGSLLLLGGKLSDLLGRKVTFLTGLAGFAAVSAIGGASALLHGYTTAFWWTAGIFAGGAVVCGALVRSGPLAQPGPPPPARGAAPAQAQAGPDVPAITRRVPDGTWRDPDTA